eukprot:EC795974.1.p2 GENE.EC795974.1~~EC795974.1.p2  ORF type:complete len:145 (+),score=40.28 EC795974.1:81-515(+)
MGCGTSKSAEPVAAANKAQSPAAANSETAAAAPRSQSDERLAALQAQLDSDKWPAIRRKAFQTVDENNSGSIDASELLRALSAIYSEYADDLRGVKEPTQAEVAELLKSQDKDGNGTLNEEEFGVLAKRMILTEAQLAAQAGRL